MEDIENQNQQVTPEERSFNRWFFFICGGSFSLLIFLTIFLFMVGGKSINLFVRESVMASRP